MTWPEHDLRYIDANDDFRMAPFREDGVTPGTLIWVWAVVVDSGVFVRSANPRSRRFAAALAQGHGIAQSDGRQHTVHFQHVTDGSLRDRVDEAFMRKYEADPYFSPDVLSRSRAQIVCITPVVTEEVADDDIAGQRAVGPRR